MIYPKWLWGIVISHKSYGYAVPAERLTLRNRTSIRLIFVTVANEIGSALHTHRFILGHSTKSH